MKSAKGNLYKGEKNTQGSSNLKVEEKIEKVGIPTCLTSIVHVPVSESPA